MPIHPQFRLSSTRQPKYLVPESSPTNNKNQGKAPGRTRILAPRVPNRIRCVTRASELSVHRLNRGTINNTPTCVVAPPAQRDYYWIGWSQPIIIIYIYIYKRTSGDRGKEGPPLPPPEGGSSDTKTHDNSHHGAFKPRRDN